jgi:non-ribosomal peptide synthetase component E (peptide arylation enzyme)
MQPVLTAESFVPNPYPVSAGERMYRTGDLARWFEDGCVEFLGRGDHQVKLRGYRIELGEIEAVLGRHGDIAQAVVLLREDEPGEGQLVAYVVAVGGTQVEAAHLRAYLKKAVPEYMIPSAYVILDQMPLNPSGKVDRRALPPPKRTRPEIETLTPPRSQTEQILVDIWKDVLNLERVGVNENFFELGGHSLLVMRIINRARDVFQADIPIRRLFESPTIAEFAVHIDQLNLLARQPQTTSGKSGADREMYEL